MHAAMPELVKYTRTCGRANKPALAHLLVHIVVISACWTAYVRAQDKGASLSLRTKWSNTAYLLEAAEMLAEEEHQKFWSFLEASFSAPQPTDSSKCWSYIVNLTSHHIETDMSKVVPLVLASRQYSAKVALYQQLRQELHPATPGCCLVDVEGTTATSVEQLPAALQAAQATSATRQQRHSQVFETDHIFPAKVNVPGAALAVLYAPVGAACAKQLHYALKVAADAGHVTYVYRPVLHDSCSDTEGSCCAAGSQGPLYLPGWGVEAVLKNTEYSAMDEKDKQQQQQGQEADTPDQSQPGQLGQHKGFDFDVLVERKPSLAQELLTFRDHLLSSDDEENVKVWELKDVGLQATQRIMTAADPLSLLTEISQNFPSLVSSLSQQRVNSSLRHAVASNQQYISPGANFMLLNGLTVDINDFDYFGFIDRLKAELRLMSQLAALGLQQEDVQALLQLRAEDSSDTLTDARLDLGLTDPGSTVHKYVAFANDVENDSMYTDRYGSSIQEILQVYPGRLKPLALNIYTLLVMCDLTSAQSVRVSDLLQKLLQDGYPIRMGVIPAVPAVLERVLAARSNPGSPATEPSWAYKTAAEKAGLAFVTLRHAYDDRAATNFWFSLGKAVQRAGTWGDIDTVLQTTFEAAWSKASADWSSSATPNGKKARKKTGKAAWKDLLAGKEWSSQAGEQLAEQVLWLHTKGAMGHEGPTGWFNGMQVTFSAGSDIVGLQQEILYMMMMEQQRIQELVYFGAVDEADAVLPSLLEKGNVTRWNPDIINPSTPREVKQMSNLVSDKDYPTSIPFFTTTQTDTEEGQTLHAATHLVVLNLASAEARKLAAEALRFIREGLPGSDVSRVLLVLNPSEQTAALANAPTTLLEVAVHVGLSHCPQFAGQTNGRYTTANVLQFMTALLADVPLSARLAGPISDISMTEIDIIVEYAKQAKLDASSFQKSITSIVAAQQDSSGGAHYRATPEMIKQRKKHARMARELLGLQNGESALITNGRVITRLPATAVHSDAAQKEAMKEVLAEDLSLLSSIAASYQPGQAIAAMVSSAHAGGRIKLTDSTKGDAVIARLDDIIAAASAAMASSTKADNKHTSKQLLQVLDHLKGRTIEINSPEGLQPSGLKIVCILNPLTRPAQRISQVLLMLRNSVLAPSITLLLNPQRDLSDLPLKAFYRYALPDIPEGEASLQSMPGQPAAYFTRLPRKRVLTMNMDVPEAWLVEAVQAQHDLDNLRLADIPEPIAQAELELRALMLTGSCIDVTGPRGTPPRGLQLHLGTVSQPHVVDTLVMSNLAYFQLKAAPGRWLMSLAPGRTRDIYQLVSSTGLQDTSQAVSAHSPEGSDTESVTNITTTQVVVQSLAGKHMILRVKKRPGKEMEDVLREAGENMEETDPWAHILDDYNDDEYDDSGGVKPATPRGGEVINVFTVASGHMYERLQKIMILSVLNNTKSKVKFWFISNYMSPHHKQVIPAMAEKFGFEWEFVTYKWPHWLHKQTDKQRIIWAYKILFLDVLFPLNVERIIFVDSDQVVRTDLAELYHMDIKGRPYAYTPFCNNNKEMDEFRFWKGGFWHNHLAGKPYHISALYLVDLKKFRAMAAGDKLRVIYDQLSKDPNSLANLDQDLPNYAQHSIPIFSLPQEWLWCESWCGQPTKHKAKTIDLCNNPKTKEPKLQAARRIISEWPELDRIQADFTQQIDKELGFETITSAQDTPAAESSNLAEAIEQAQQETVTRRKDEAGDSQSDVTEGTSVAPSHQSSTDHTEL